MKCCGADVSTPFCPQCGKRLQDPNSPEALLVYLRRQATKHERMAAKLRLRVSQPSGDTRTPQVRERRAASAERIWQKWQSWAAALERLLGSQQEEVA